MLRKLLKIRDCDLRLQDSRKHTQKNRLHDLLQMVLRFQEEEVSEFHNILGTPHPVYLLN